MPGESKEPLDKSLSRVGKNDTDEIIPTTTRWKDLTTLLLHMFGERVRKMSPSDIMKNYNENRFTNISDIDQKLLNQIDSVFYKSLPAKFKTVEISPVAPVGTNHVLTGLDPKTTVSTIRRSDVQSDSSIALALECASRRKKGYSGSDVHLATSHRVIRAQKYDPDSGFSPHFRAFALASSGRDPGMGKFFMGSMGSHIKCWLDFIEDFKRSGVNIPRIEVRISNIEIANALLKSGTINKRTLKKKADDPDYELFDNLGVSLSPTTKDIKETSFSDHPELESHIKVLGYFEDSVLNDLRKSYPDVDFVFDLERTHGAGYYDGLCYVVNVDNASGTTVPLADGGVTNWMKKLMSSKKEHFVASGFGTELFAKSFLK